MGTDCDHGRILALFESAKLPERSRAIAAAYDDPHADALMAKMLDTSTDNVYERVTLAAHLGDFEGGPGTAALERAVQATGRGSRDLRCAALLALAKREGEKASPVLRAALAGTKDGTVKHYAILGLAGAGDDSAWDQVFQQLQATLRRTRRTAEQSEVAMALAYLAQHIDDDDRRRQLVDFVRQHWSAIGEGGWFGRYWSVAGPDGPAEDAVPPPDPEAIRAWARDPLFRRLGPPLSFG